MLSILDVHASYGKVTALFGISLKINEGELVALIGANGAGKSTTLRAVMGLVKVNSGSVDFQGESIRALSCRQIVSKGISLCPEGRRLWPAMTVKENLLLGALLRTDNSKVRADLDRMYDYFPILKSRAEQMAGSLSGGEQQMAAIARALMADPRLLMLDEPSLGLSPIVIEKVSEIIDDIHHSGTTILLVEQNAFLALNMSDRCYVLEVGQVAVEGASSELLQNEYVRSAYLGQKRSSSDSASNA